MHVIKELGFLVHGVMPMYCDNQAIIFRANNHTFHECIKHIEIDCPTIRHRVLDGFITTPYVCSAHQLEDILTKGVSMAAYNSISHKLGFFDLYALS